MQWPLTPCYLLPSGVGGNLEGVLGGGQAVNLSVNPPTRLLPPGQMTIMVVLLYDHTGGRLQSVPIIVLLSLLVVLEVGLILHSIVGEQ